MKGPASRFLDMAWVLLAAGAGYAFINEAQDETISFSAQVAPRLLRFLKTAL